MQIWGTGGYECKALVPSAHVKWAKSFPKSQPGKHMIPFAMVECCTLFFCNYNGLICVGWVRLAYQSLIYWILVSAVHLEEQQYLAGWVGLWFHCNQDSFVKILLLSGAWGFWEEEVFLPPPPPPFFFLLHGGFFSLPSPRLLFMLSLDLLLVPLFLHIVKVSFCVTRSLFSRPYCEWRASVCCLILAMLGSQLGCN